MRHIQTITQAPAVAQDGTTTAIELLIQVLISVFFADWDNFQPVLQFLNKYFAKTP